MPYEEGGIDAKLGQWTQYLTEYTLPRWEELPQLDLYMDQVIILLTRYLGPIVRDSDAKGDKSITASIINNYVRMKIMPPPVKKRYTRVHLAYLLVICSLKQSLSISCIQKMLPQEWTEEAARAMYTGFTAAFHATSAVFSERVRQDGSEQGNISIVTSLAILSNLSKCLTEFLLREDPADEDDDDDYDD